jgi:hypothetical protein
MEKSRSTDTALMGMSGSLKVCYDSVVQVLYVCCHATNS